MEIIEATTNFYDNQDLAFANDIELKDLTQKYLEADQQLKHLKLEFNRQLKIEAQKIQDEHQSTITKQLAEISRFKVLNKQLSAQLQQKESELVQLRKENKKFKDYFTSNE